MECRTIGKRKDGWRIVVTEEVLLNNTNIFEINYCKCCGKQQRRPHDAEGWRKEQLEKRSKIPK